MKNELDLLKELDQHRRALGKYSNNVGNVIGELNKIRITRKVIDGFVGIKISVDGSTMEVSHENIMDLINLLDAVFTKSNDEVPF